MNTFTCYLFIIINLFILLDQVVDGFQNFNLRCNKKVEFFPRNIAISTTVNDRNNPSNIKQGNSTFRKPKYKSSMIKYEEELSKPWQLSDSVNSTTLKLLFNLQEEISNIWFKVEQQFSSWSFMITSKVERDIRMTLSASDYVTRRVTKDTEKLFTGAQELQKPIKSLPSKLRAITSKSETLSMLMQGVDTTEGSKLLGGFNSQSTKQRSVQLKKKKQQLTLPTGGVDSLYRSITTLPSKLQYDYQRRVVKQKLNIGDTDVMLTTKRMLPSSSPANLALISSETKIKFIDENAEDQQSMSNSETITSNESESGILVEQISKFNEAIANIVSLATRNTFSKLLVIMQKVQSAVFDRQIDKWLLERQLLQSSSLSISEDITLLSIAINSVRSLDKIKNQYNNNQSNSRRKFTEDSSRVDEYLVINKEAIAIALDGMRRMSFIQNQLSEMKSSSSISNSDNVIGENNLESDDDVIYLFLKDAADDITSILVRDEKLLTNTYTALEAILTVLNDNSAAVHGHGTTNMVIESSEIITTEQHSVPKIDLQDPSYVVEPDNDRIINFENVYQTGTQKVREANNLNDSEFLPMDGGKSQSFDNKYVSVKFTDIAKFIVDSSKDDPVYSASGTVVETSAETSDTTEVQVIKFVITTVDVVFFLLETLVKAVGPLLKDGGQIAIQRMIDTLFIPSDLLGLPGLSLLFRSSLSTYNKLTMKGPILMSVPMNETLQISLLDTSINWRIYNQFKTKQRRGYVNSNDPQI